MTTYPRHIDELDDKKRSVPALYTDESTLGEEVGMGLFAGEDIVHGTHLGWYYGRPYSIHPENGSHYILEVEKKPCWVTPAVWSKKVRGKGLLIDGGSERPTRGAMSLLFRFSMLNHDDGEKTNVKFLQNGRVVALKNIKKGSEMFLNYGPHFFDEEA